MFVCCECCEVSGRGLCDRLITCPEDNFQHFLSYSNKFAAFYFTCLFDIMLTYSYTEVAVCKSLPAILFL